MNDTKISELSDRLDKAVGGCVAKLGGRIMINIKLSDNPVTTRALGSQAFHLTRILFPHLGNSSYISPSRHVHTRDQE